MIICSLTECFCLPKAALVSVQPSAKREGFATIPDVTWDDIGALKDVREELTMAILVHIYIELLKSLLNLVVHLASV